MCGPGKGMHPFTGPPLQLPHPALMASRCRAPSRGCQPHPKPQPEGPSRGDLCQAKARTAHSLDLGRQGLGSNCTAFIYDRDLGDQRCLAQRAPLRPGPCAHP